MKTFSAIWTFLTTERSLGGKKVVRTARQRRRRQRGVALVTVLIAIALTLEDKIGTMLPCNVIVQQREGGKVEVSAVDPVASMQAIDNPDLGEVAKEVRAKLKRVVDSL